jgi:hypothetical protein
MKKADRKQLDEKLRGLIKQAAVGKQEEMIRLFDAAQKNYAKCKPGEQQQRLQVITDLLQAYLGMGITETKQLLRIGFSDGTYYDLEV